MAKGADIVMSLLGSQTTAVVEREHNILGIDEARTNRAACIKAMADELERGRSLGTFR